MKHKDDLGDLAKDRDKIHRGKGITKQRRKEKAKSRARRQAQKVKEITRCTDK